MIPSSGSDKANLQVDGSVLHRISPSPSRVLIGVNQFNDENQQNLRIQQAVNRYNGTSLPPYCRPSAAFKCSLLKSKALGTFPSDESVSSDDSKQKQDTRYAFPGHFPTVVLGKTQMRPNKKQSILSQLRSSTSGLPVSRFLDDSAEKYSDLKPTRSVLEVLQDLSRKRIHGKDENDDATKRRCKGLGGDLAVEGDIPYQPLFESKQKGLNLQKRDQMTQTLLNSQSGTQMLSSPSKDSKWELRKKLAMKNNEIFASLSSSIAGTFFAKRKRVRNSTTLDSDDKLAKKRKKVDTPTITFNDTAIQRDDKKNRRESIARSPPTKDRLMNIFHEMQSNATIKQDALKAMNNEAQLIQLQRQISDKISDAQQSNDEGSAGVCFENTDKSLICIDSKLQDEVQPLGSSNQLHILDPLGKKNESDVNEEKTDKPSSTNTSFSFGVSAIEKNSGNCSTSLHLNTPNIGVSSSTQLTPAAETKKPESASFQFGASSPTKVSFQPNSTTTAPTSNFNYGATSLETKIVSSLDSKASSPSLVSATKSNLTSRDNVTSISSTSSLFSFGPSKVEPSGTQPNTPTSFSAFSLTQTSITSHSTNSLPTQKIVNTSPTFSFENSKPTASASIIDNTSPTFSFENSKPTASASVVPSSILLDSKPENVSNTATTSSTSSPLFSFGQSSAKIAETSTFTFGSKSEVSVQEPSLSVKQEKSPKEGFSFSKNVSMPTWSITPSDDKDKKIESIEAPKSNSTMFGSAELKVPSSISSPTSSFAEDKNKISLTSLGDASKAPSVFSRLGQSVSSNQEILISTTKGTEDDKKEPANDLSVEASKPLTGSSIFAGSSIDRNVSKTDALSSSPLFTESKPATSAVFSFGSCDKPTFSFNQINETKNNSKTKTFSFGSVSNIASENDDKAGNKSLSVHVPTTSWSSLFNAEKLQSTGPSSSITPFNFGNHEAVASKTVSSSEKPHANGPSSTIAPFSFGNHEASTPKTVSSSEKPHANGPSSFGAPFNFGNNETSVPNTVSLVAPVVSTSTITAFGNVLSSQSANTVSAPVALASNSSLFGGSTSNVATSHSSFGTSVSTSTASLFGPTTGSSIFNTTTGFGTTPSTTGFGNFGTTAAPAGFGNTNTSSVPSFGNENTFGSTSTTTSGFAASSATPTFGSTTNFGTSTTGFGSSFGAPPTTTSTFAFGNSLAPGTTTPSTFGVPTASSPFGGVATSTATPAFGTSTTFASGNSSFGASATPGFGNTAGNGFGSGSTGFNNNNASSPFGSAGSAFGPSTNSGTSGFSTNTPTFGNSLSPFTSNTAQPFGNGSTFGNGVNPSSGNSATSFGNSNTTAPTFGFGVQQSSQAISTVPSFNFTSTSATAPLNQTSTPFNFGSASSGSGSSVFNFGANSASNNVKPFCFGSNNSGFAQTPTPGSSQTPTPGSSGFQTASPFTSSGAFSLPGTFSIGSGSSQPRSRSASRFRRRT